jgi:hypothetical protein
MMAPVARPASRRGSLRQSLLHQDDMSPRQKGREKTSFSTASRSRSGNRSHDGRESFHEIHRPREWPVLPSWCGALRHGRPTTIPSAKAVLGFLRAYRRQQREARVFGRTGRRQARRGTFARPLSRHRGCGWFEQYANAISPPTSAYDMAEVRRYRGTLRFPLVETICSCRPSPIDLDERDFRGLSFAGLTGSTSSRRRRGP